MIMEQFVFTKKRRHPRTDISMPTKFRTLDSQVYERGRIRDISSSGVRLETDVSLLKGDLIEFIVDNGAYDEHYIAATARVKWTGRSPTYYDGTIDEAIYKSGIEILKKELLETFQYA